ncbi:hypothetical protein [uncultured virus]|uniref:Uncharacterized protein n=1 Tax=uncultured virus TaxID=340016 RepID=A0A218MM51_9VIRU|nr:hypothetical protein [uncultured virus]
MATTTATITLSSADLTGDALSLSTTATLTKGGTLTGLDQTTGVARKFYASAQANTTLIAAADYTAGRAHKVYIKNTSTTASEFVKVELGSGNLSVGFLYAGDWMFIPYDGENDIDIDTSDVNMTVEYLVIYEA